MYVLHYVFLPRLNFALQEFTGAFNLRPMRTEHNWSPNKIWSNGMINPNNSMQTALRDPVVDDVDPDNVELFGIDHDGPIPPEESTDVTVALYHKKCYLYCNKEWTRYELQILMVLTYT